MWIWTSMQNISSFHLFILIIQSISESCDQPGHAHFWACPNKHFWSTFNLCKLTSRSKKSGYFIRFGDMVDLKILQFDWLRTFWPISQEQKFFQIWDLGRNTTKNISFHYRTNSIKMKDAPKAFGDFKNKQKSVWSN